MDANVRQPVNCGHRDLTGIHRLVADRLGFTGFANMEWSHEQLDTSSRSYWFFPVGFSTGRLGMDTALGRNVWPAPNTGRKTRGQRQSRL